MTDATSNEPPYETYKGLPPLAGICSMHEAMMPGASVETCVSRLKRFHYVFKRLHEITNARITAEPIYELKSAFSYHSYLCAEQVTAMRTRVAEMRTPPLHLDVVPDERLEVIFDEILAAPTTESLIFGVYEFALPAIRDGLEHHIDTTNHLADHPSVRVCRHALLDVDEMLKFGRRAVECLINDDTRVALNEWLTLLQQLLAESGGMASQVDPAPAQATRMFSETPYTFDPAPKRDERFTDSYNAGVNAEAFLYDQSMPARAKTLMMYYKRIREIDVPEMMASIIHEVSDQPWGFTSNMTRQLWDEARHALMGEVGFTAQGVDWRTIPINFTWSLNLNTQLTARERHAVLFFIEQGLMTKTGKRYEWEVGTDSGDPLAMLFQDFDWADEVLHADIGRRWLVPQFESKQAALEYGDACWGRVMTDWARYRADGLTEHRNWWPQVYTAACASWDIEPDPRALAFEQTYETTRADLKDISASG